VKSPRPRCAARAQHPRRRTDGMNHGVTEDLEDHPFRHDATAPSGGPRGEDSESPVRNDATAPSGGPGGEDSESPVRNDATAPSGGPGGEDTADITEIRAAYTPSGSRRPGCCRWGSPC
jgi:hypothetical protein